MHVIRFSFSVSSIFLLSGNREYSFERSCMSFLFVFITSLMSRLVRDGSMLKVKSLYDLPKLLANLSVSSALPTFSNASRQDLSCVSNVSIRVPSKSKIIPLIAMIDNDNSDYLTCARITCAIYAFAVRV